VEFNHFCINTGAPTESICSFQTAGWLLLARPIPLTGCVQAPNWVFSHKTHFTPLLLYALHLNERARLQPSFCGDDLSAPPLLLFKIQQLKRPRLLSKLFAS
jgi:hypothetical protein